MHAFVNIMYARIRAFMHVCKYVCMFVACIYISVCIYVYEYIYVCRHAYMRDVSINICMYVQMSV